MSERTVGVEKNQIAFYQFIEIYFDSDFGLITGDTW
jgi:hypothetical protein